MRVRLALRVVPALAAGALAAACSGVSSPPASAGGTSTSTTRTTVPGTGARGTSTTTVPFNSATNLRSDVAAPLACRRDAAGVWVWHGTVTNRSAVSHAYTIIVDFTDSADTVEATKVVDLPTVAPHQMVDWSVSGAPGKSGVLCVIRRARTP